MHLRVVSDRPDVAAYVPPLAFRLARERSSRVRAAASTRPAAMFQARSAIHVRENRNLVDQLSGKVNCKKEVISDPVYPYGRK